MYLDTAVGLYSVRRRVQVPHSLLRKAADCVGDIMQGWSPSWEEIIGIYLQRIQRRIYPPLGAMLYSNSACDVCNTG